MKPDNTHLQTEEVSQKELMVFYHTLLSRYGHQGWWPSEGWFETIAGAILAQNVSWTGASRAVSALKQAGLLTPRILADTDKEIIAPLIRSSRYYNQKADRLIVFAYWFMDLYNGEITRMQQEETRELRERILALPGFGPETTDSILLYACNKPVFVVDAYTRRIGSWIGWYPEDASYQVMQEFYMSRLLTDTALFNDFHAQIVNLGSIICRNHPLCDTCPVREVSGQCFCHYAGTSCYLKRDAGKKTKITVDESRMIRSGVTTPIEEAFDRTISLLWPPRPGIWIRIALIALFLGGGMTNPFETDGFRWSEISKPGFSDPSLITAYTDVIILIGAGLLIAGLIYIIISAIIQFVFVDCISSGKVLLTRTLKIRWEKGLRLVGFYLVLLFFILLAIIVVTWIFILPAFLTGIPDFITMLILLIEALVILLVILIPVWIIAILTADFVVPVMIVDDIGILSGWRRVINLFTGKWTEAGIYIGFKILLLVISGIILGIIIFLLSIPMGITRVVLKVNAGFTPVISFYDTVLIVLGTGVMVLISLLLLVPVITFFRHYSLVVLRDLDKKYNLLPGIHGESG